MKTTPLTAAVAALLAGLATGLAVETPVQPQIDSVGLFKNGVAVVRASFTVPGPGTYRWDAVPQTIHGTFAVDSDAVLSTTATHRIVEEELKSAPTGMQDALAGKNVTVTLQSAGVSGSGPANLREGRVWAVPAVPSNNPFSTRIEVIAETAVYHLGSSVVPLVGRGERGSGVTFSVTESRRFGRR